MANGDIQLVPSDNLVRVEIEGGSQARSTTRRRRRRGKRAREIARRDKVELLVHGRTHPRAQYGRHGSTSLEG